VSGDQEDAAAPLRGGAASSTAAAEGWPLRWWRRWGAGVRCGVTAVAAWVITVAPVATGHDAGTAERVLAALCLLAGVCAPVLVAERPRLARSLGLTAFVGLAALSWALTTWERGFPAFDAFRGALGAAAWALYALSWSEPYSVSVSSGAERIDPLPGARLAARRRAPPSATIVAAATIALALLCLLLPWRVAEPSRAVLAHAFGVGAAVALIASASSLVVLATRGPAAGRSGSPVARPAMRALIRSVVLMVATSVVVLVLLAGRC